MSRPNLRRISQKAVDDADEEWSDVERGGEKVTVSCGLPIAELTVDTTFAGMGSTPKSSPASFSDVSILQLTQKV